MFKSLTIKFNKVKPVGWNDENEQGSPASTQVQQAPTKEEKECENKSFQTKTTPDTFEESPSERQEKDPEKNTSEDVTTNPDSRVPAEPIRTAPGQEDTRTGKDGSTRQIKE